MIAPPLLYTITVEHLTPLTLLCWTDGKKIVINMDIGGPQPLMHVPPDVTYVMRNMQGAEELIRALPAVSTVYVIPHTLEEFLSLRRMFMHLDMRMLILDQVK